MTLSHLHLIHCVTCPNLSSATSLSLLPLPLAQSFLLCSMFKSKAPRHPFVVGDRWRRRRRRTSWFGFFFVFFLLTVAGLAMAEEEMVKTFIFFVDPTLKPSAFASHVNWYSSLLPSSTRLLHRYHSLLHGFSASLTVSQATSLVAARCGVVAVIPDSVLRLHTTRSPSFLGLGRPGSRLSAVSRGGSAAVIGFLDTGIWPEHPSFSDRSLSPPPRHWRGACEEGPGFNRSSCNRKLVGARVFSAGYFAAFGGGEELRSARDFDGHGTHVASIAGGAPVLGAEFEGFAGGVARGVAPRARIAAYKVCWAAGCMVSDVVAAIEKAVNDGVDVLSLSIGSASPAPLYHLDPLAVATFRATMRGVFVAASAGNGGPTPGSVANAPPWITTVGAGTIDRKFPAVVRLGNGVRVRGTSISIRPPWRRRPCALHPLPLLSAGKITGGGNITTTSLRINGSIVFWESTRHSSRIETVAAMKRSGAVGTVVFHGDVDPEAILAEPHLLRTIAVGSQGAATIDAYVKTSPNPTAVICSEGTVVQPGDGAPVVASFSARGPNPAVPSAALKPDILAPGVDILGAWTGAIGPSGSPSDIRRPSFNVMSGTSMACPHVAAVAALVRTAHPEWGPGEIRSALMTAAATSTVGDEAGEGGPPAMGAGHLRPESAAAPGLVYDLDGDDYVGLLCGLNYTEDAIKIIAGEGARCAASSSTTTGFNYPGFVATAEEVDEKGEVVFRRRLRRVPDRDGGGGTGRWYAAEVAAPEGYEIAVEPERVYFGGEEEQDSVEFRLVLRCAINGGPRGSKRRGWWWRAGSLMWAEEARERRRTRTVRSPIVVFNFR